MNQQAVIEQAVALVAAQLEGQLDSEINKLDNLGQSDIAEIRRKRMADLQKRQAKTQEWLAKGQKSPHLTG